MYCGFKTKRNRCLWLISLLFVVGAVLAAIVFGSQIPKCRNEIDVLAKDDGALHRMTLFLGDTIIPSVLAGSILQRTATSQL
jgi:nitrate reductase gamma subunit